MVEHIPCYLEDSPNMIATTDEAKEIDDLDLRLLEALQRNARATFAELGAYVGLKPPAVHERVKRLERRGYLRGYGARLDARRLGLGLTAFVSCYTTHDCDYDDFMRHLSALPEVCEVHSVAGEESYICKVVTRSTEHLDDLLARLKAMRGMARTRTTIVLSTPYEREGISLAC
jgi:Lrp/AsnC family leucine-responsive transcriptional regulator